MQTILKGGALIEQRWVTPGPEDPIPTDTNAIVPLARYLSAADDLRDAAKAGRLAVSLNGEDNIRDIEGELDAFSLIVLEFPKFADGRCYSHARVLREHMGYKGDLRAVGDVLRDQMHYMHRCGINEFVVRSDKDPLDALKAFSTFSVTYEEKQGA